MTDVTELHNGRMALRGVGKMKSKRWPQSYQVGPPIKTSVNSRNTLEPFAEILAEDKWGLAVYKAHSASVRGGNMDVCVASPLIFSCSEAHRTMSRQVWRHRHLGSHKYVTTFSISSAIILESGLPGPRKCLDGRNKWRDPQAFLWTRAGPWSPSRDNFELRQTQFQMQMGVIQL